MTQQKVLIGIGITVVALLSVLIVLVGMSLMTPQTEDTQMPPQHMPGMDESAMPCHQMPDGSWMGDCPEELFSAEQQRPDGLPPAQESKEYLLDETFELFARPVAYSVGNTTIQGYAYNDQIPGPLLRTQQHSTARVEFTNLLSEDTTVHWHGLRHDIKDDGVPGVSQDPMRTNDTFTYELFFPDAGLYWYHPHIREDRQQDLGMAGLIIVDPQEPYPEVDAEHALLFNDILLTDEGVVAYGEPYPNFALMGRFGNTLLVNGLKDWEVAAQQGDVVRLYLANAASARPYNISIEGAEMKVVAADLSRYDQSFFADSVVLGPAERAIVDIYLPETGTYRLLHTTPSGVHEMGRITAESEGSSAFAEDFFATHTYDVLSEEELAYWREQDPHHAITLTVDTGMHMPCHQMPDGSWMGDCAEHGHAPPPIEWEDHMPMMNAQSSTQNTRWKLTEDGHDLMHRNLTAHVGDVVKVRLDNTLGSAHPMHHPIHVHGQRFVVLAQDGLPPEQVAWKDTVLVPAGSVYDILIEVTNPGAWMIHCHIPEHMEAGMMTFLEVTP